MIDIEVLKKLRNGLMDKSIVVVSDNPQIDRIKLIEALSQEIAKLDKEK